MTQLLVSLKANICIAYSRAADEMCRSVNDMYPEEGGHAMPMDHGHGQRYSQEYPFYQNPYATNAPIDPRLYTQDQASHPEPPPSYYEHMGHAFYSNIGTPSYPPYHPDREPRRRARRSYHDEMPLTDDNMGADNAPSVQPAEKAPSVRSDDPLFVPEQNGDPGDGAVGTGSKQDEESESPAPSRARLAKEDYLESMKKSRKAAKSRRGNDPTWKASKAKIDAAFNEAQEKGGNEKTPESETVESISKRQKKSTWEVHRQAKMVDAKKYSTAYKVKRGVAKKSKNKRVAANAKGPNNPDNILIVQLKESGMNFKKIAEIINRRRIARGELPSFTPNNMNCRYNRSAPSLFQLQGRKFVPLANRTTSKGQVGSHKPTEQEQKAIWEEDMDLAVVEFAREYDEAKWEVVGERVRNEFPDTEYPEWPTAEDCAYRFHQI
jgi:hypothetical protein